MSSAEAKNLEAISKAIDQHNEGCEWPAVAVELNPFEVERLGWDSIRGPADPGQPGARHGRFRVVCAREEGEPGGDGRGRGRADGAGRAGHRPLALPGIRNLRWVVVSSLCSGAA